MLPIERGDFLPYLQAHGAELRIMPPRFWEDAPHVAELWADGRCFDRVSVPVNQIARQTFDAAYALRQFGAAQEALCERYLVSIGLLHPNDMTESGP